MSLLLEALKKAELAKQGSMGAAPQDLDSGGIRFEESNEPTPSPDPLPKYSEPVVEQAELAPITSEPEPIIAAPRPPRPAAKLEPDVVSPPSQNSQRVAARQMFEAKEVDYNPKRPFYITLGVLGLAAVGYGAYLWWQLQPKYSVNTATIQNAPKSAPIAKPAVAPSPEAAQANDPAAPTSDAKSEAQMAAPSTISTPPAVVATTAGAAPAAKAPAGAAPAGVVPSAPAPLTSAAAQPAAPTVAAALQKPGKPAAAAPAAIAPSVAPSASSLPQKPAAPRPARLPIKVTPPAFQGNAVLESAFAAFQRGELDRARSEYQQVLGRETNNRDALLGLAAIDVRTRDYETAELRYLKLLELDPRDVHAHAALISLHGNVDPVQLESRIKNLIAVQPDATHLYFTLGNQYAAQSRWAEAQDAYFKAYSAEPENADFAFNLAVSLDHLRQGRLAGEYYRRAVSVSGTRVVGFDRKQAEARAKDLEQ